VTTQNLHYIPRCKASQTLCGGNTAKEYLCAYVLTRRDTFRLYETSRQVSMPNPSPFRMEAGYELKRAIQRILGAV
jgi:hypothetical protein